MSLSNPRGQSPVRKYFKVRSSTGDVVYYDKSQSKEIEVPVPFSFIVLDVLNTVGGFHEPSKSGIWSNEFRSSSRDVVKVRNKNGSLAEGTYNQIKNDIKAAGGKFANSVYIAYKEGNETVLGNIVFIGASVSEWFDFGKGKSFDSDPGVTVTGFEHRTKGRNEYYVPTFGRFDVPEHALQEAAGLDRALQEYLSGALSAPAEPAPEPQQQSTSPWGSSSAGRSDFDEEPPF